MNFWTDSLGRILSPLTATYPLRPGGRLTLTSGVPVTTSDVTNATTIYYTPYVSNVISLWNGNAWQTITFSEVSLLIQSFYQNRLTTTGNTGPINSGPIKSIPSTAAIQVGDMVDDHVAIFGSGTYVISVDSANQVTTNTPCQAVTTGQTFYFNYPCYDIFGYLDSNNGLTLATLPWANRTTRQTALAMTDGVYTLSTDKTRLYLGTIYLTSAWAGKFAANGYVTSDSMSSRLVWNNYNRVVRPLLYPISTASWSYGSAAWRWANGYNGMVSGAATSPLAAVAWVVGLNEDPVMAEVLCSTNATTNSTSGNVGIAIDASLSAPTIPSIPSQDYVSEVSIGTGTIIALSHAAFCRLFGAGYHYAAWLEFARTGTPTFYGAAPYGNISVMWGTLRA